MGHRMDGGKTCPICFVEYTTNGAHRITSLKCGHLFGSDCIERWIKLYKRGYCPTCSAPCKKSQLRPVFASEVTAVDTSKESEMIEKYVAIVEKNKALEKELKNLKAQIDVLKMKTVVTVEEEFKIHNRSLRYEKIHFVPSKNFIGIDPVNSVILSTHGNGFYKYSTNGFSIHSFVKTDEPISDLKVSPFKDGLLLLAAGKEVLLVNIYSEVVLRRFEFAKKICRVCFDETNKEVCYFVDDSGFFYSLSILSNATMMVRLSKNAIHSLCMVSNFVYASTLFETFRVEPLHSEIRFSKVPMDINGICTNISSNGSTAILTLRDNEMNVKIAMIGQKEIVFDPAAKQFFRHTDRIYSSYIYVVDDSTKSIKVFDIHSLKMVYVYAFKEEIIDFVVSSLLFVVLTKKGVFLFDKAS